MAGLPSRKPDGLDQQSEPTGSVVIEKRRGALMPRLAAKLLRSREDISEVVVTPNEDGTVQIKAVSTRRSLIEVVRDMGFAVLEKTA